MTVEFPVQGPQYGTPDLWVRISDAHCEELVNHLTNNLDRMTAGLVDNGVVDK